MCNGVQPGWAAICDEEACSVSVCVIGEGCGGIDFERGAEHHKDIGLADPLLGFLEGVGGDEVAEKDDVGSDEAAATGAVGDFPAAYLFIDMVAGAGVIAVEAVEVEDIAVKFDYILRAGFGMEAVDVLCDEGLEEVFLFETGQHLMGWVGCFVGEGVNVLDGDFVVFFGAGEKEIEFECLGGDF